jgi:hypothetical protein
VVARVELAQKIRKGESDVSMEEVSSIKGIKLEEVKEQFEVYKKKFFLDSSYFDKQISQFPPDIRAEWDKLVAKYPLPSLNDEKK